MKDQLSKRTMIFAGALSALSLIAAGCSSGSSTSSAAAPSKTFVDLYAGIPALGTEPEAATGTTDTALADLYSPLLISAGNVNGSVYTWNTADIVPNLATSFTDSNGVYTLQLRHNVRACNGDQLTAQDVVFAVDRAEQVTDAPGTASSFDYEQAGVLSPGASAKQNLQGSVTATGPYTVVFRTKVDNGLLPPELAQPATAPIDEALVKKHATPSDPFGFTYLKTKSAGFGPYCVASYTANQQIVLTRNPYWNVAPIPHFQKVIMQAVPSDANRYAELVRGQANAAEKLTAAEYSTLLKSHAAQVISDYSTTFNYHLNLSYSSPTWGPSGSAKAAAVRKAIAQAIPYESIIKVALGGFGHVWQGEVPPAIPGAMSNPSLFTQNISAAKADLAAAGYPGGKGLPTAGLQLSYDAADAGTYQPMAELIKSSLAQIGINVTLNPVPDATFNAQQASYPMAIAPGGTNIYSTAFYTELWYAAPTAGGLVDVDGYNNPALNALALQAAKTHGQAQETIGTQEQAIEMHDLPAIPLVIIPEQGAVANNIQGMSENNWGEYYPVTSAKS